jgi:hypothetical protein
MASVAASRGGVHVLQYGETLVPSAPEITFTESGFPPTELLPEIFEHEQG